ncbi:MAG: hypothetical protein FK734_08085 [Asgard group archaeon]|nr:hypothetical protein [Asgard group archaeon]
MANKYLKRLHIKTIINYLHPKMIWGIIIRERIFLKRFKKLLREINWDDLAIKPGGFAANGSFLYYLAKIYHELQPKKTLELGSGQTSKLAHRYTIENKLATVITLENHTVWFNTFNGNFTNHRFQYLLRPLKECSFCEQSCLWYDITAEDRKLLSNINLLIIDGPFGTKHFSRVGIVSLLPDILAKDDFIIIVDDAQRKGEIDTIKLIEKLLQKHTIDYLRKDFWGFKKQTILYTINHQEFFN